MRSGDSLVDAAISGPRYPNKLRLAPKACSGPMGPSPELASEATGCNRVLKLHLPKKALGSASVFFGIPHYCSVFALSVCLSVSFLCLLNSQSPFIFTGGMPPMPIQGPIDSVNASPYYAPR